MCLNKVLVDVRTTGKGWKILEWDFKEDRWLTHGFQCPVRVGRWLTAKNKNVRYTDKDSPDIGFHVYLDQQDADIAKSKLESHAYWTNTVSRFCVVEVSFRDVTVIGLGDGMGNNSIPVAVAQKIKYHELPSKPPRTRNIHKPQFVTNWGEQV